MITQRRTPKSLFFVSILMLILSSCVASTSLDEDPTASFKTEVPKPSADKIPQPSDLCKGERQLSEPYYTIRMSGASAEMLWQTTFVPWWVRTGPDGKVYAISDGSDAIYKLKPDGTLAEAFVCPRMEMESAVMASDGAFWFATRNGKVYRVDTDGSVRLMSQSGNNRYIEAGPDGSIYVQDNGMFKLDPNGTMTIVSQRAQGRKFAVSPKGEVVTLKDGIVMRVESNGELRELASGYGPEEWLTFGLDGKLYVTHWSGVDVIDLEDESVTPIAWLEYRVPGESGNFTADGKLLVYHPNTNVWVIDLETQTIDIYYRVVSNSWAVGLSPDGDIYVAFGNKEDNGETTIYRVVDRQTLEPVLSVPYGNERGMTFGLDGTGYLGVCEPQRGGIVYSFDPSNSTYKEYFTPNGCPDTLATNPVDGRVWIGVRGQYTSVNSNGQVDIIPGVPNGEDSSLAITTNGEFYAMVFFHRDDPNTSSPHSIFYLNHYKGQWEEVADVTQSDPGITMAKIIGCVGGKVFTVESLGPESTKAGHSSYNGVRRLEEDGSLTLVGFDFSYDGADVACDYTNNRVIFTSGAGIWAVKVP